MSNTSVQKSFESYLDFNASRSASSELFHISKSCDLRNAFNICLLLSPIWSMSIKCFIDLSIILTCSGILLYPLRILLLDRKSTRLNSSHVSISYAVFCLKKKNLNLNTYHMFEKHRH